MEQVIQPGAMAGNAVAHKPISGLAALSLWLGRASIALLLLLILGLAWLVAFGNPYKAGSTLGYYLGVAGGLMMLTLLLYPLRKRFSFMNRLGAMRHWFRFHMLLGMGGPLLILFHSTFKVGAVNSRIALYSMLLVAGSGIVGRFVYRHIHRGLYGSKITLNEAEEELTTSSVDMHSVLSQVPNIAHRLKAFSDYAFATAPGFSGALRFITLRIGAMRLSRSIRHEIKRLTQRLAAGEGRASRNTLKLNRELAQGRIDAYLDAVCMASQFSTWERLFSLWHVVHVPFLYLLLISGIVHVVAVHMY